MGTGDGEVMQLTLTTEVTDIKNYEMRKCRYIDVSFLHTAIIRSGSWMRGPLVWRRLP